MCKRCKECTLMYLQCMLSAFANICNLNNPTGSTCCQVKYSKSYAFVVKWHRIILPQKVSWNPLKSVSLLTSSGFVSPRLSGEHVDLQEPTVLTTPIKVAAVQMKIVLFVDLMVPRLAIFPVFFKCCTLPFWIFWLKVHLTDCQNIFACEFLLTINC